MKKYAVAFINFFDSDLKIEFVEAKNELDAFYKSNFNYFDFEPFDSLEDLKGAYFDADYAVEVKEVK